MNIIICGAGKVGFSISKQLSAQGHSVTVIDQSSEDIKKINDTQDVKGIVGKATLPSVLENAGAKDADMIIAVCVQHTCHRNIFLQGAIIQHGHCSHKFAHRAFWITSEIHPGHEELLWKPAYMIGVVNMISIHSTLHTAALHTTARLHMKARLRTTARHWTRRHATTRDGTRLHDRTRLQTTTVYNCMNAYKWYAVSHLYRTCYRAIQPILHDLRKYDFFTLLRCPLPFFIAISIGSRKYLTGI